MKMDHERKNEKWNFLYPKYETVSVFMAGIDEAEMELSVQAVLLSISMTLIPPQ